MTYRTTPNSIVCLVCGMESFNPNDREQLYCGCCHTFHERGNSQVPEEETLEERRARITSQFHAAREASKQLIVDARRDGDEAWVWCLESSLRSMEKAYTRFIGQNQPSKGSTKL